MQVREDWSATDDGKLTIREGGPRVLERFGDALVLLFASTSLSYRHMMVMDAGGSHDYEEYQPHVTIALGVDPERDISLIQPYQGKLAFGPEIWQEID
jgi:hypothetical protein